MKNAIADFFEQGKSFSSYEGQKLVKDSERQEIKGALKNPKVVIALVNAMNESADPFFRRKILLAISDNN